MIERTFAYMFPIIQKVIIHESLHVEGTRLVMFHFKLYLRVQSFIYKLHNASHVSGCDVNAHTVFAVHHLYGV